MRIAILSDIHGNLPALQAVLAEVAAAAVDLTVNLGDIVSGPLWPAETAELLMSLDLPTLRGNHERQLLDDRPAMGASDAFAAAALAPAHKAWLAALPTTLALGEGVFCCHGTPGSDLQYLLETVTPDLGQHGSAGVRAARADEVAARLAPPHAPCPPGTGLLLCGHTHMPRLAWHAGVLVANPGSVGLPAFDDDHPFPHRMETGSPHARWALAERGPLGWRVELRATAYDWAQAALRAEAEGRADWADALRSGRVGRLEAQVLAAAGGDRQPAG